MTRNDIKREYPDRPISAVAGVVIQNDFVLLVKKAIVAKKVKASL